MHSLFNKDIWYINQGSFVKKFIIAICLSLLMINRIFSQDCLAPNSFIKSEESSFYPYNWQSVKRVIVDILFESDKRNAEFVLSETYYKNIHLEYFRNLSHKSAVDGIIRTLIKYQQAFPDDFSVEEEKNFSNLIILLREIKEKSIKQIRKSLSNNYSLEKWYIRAGNYFQSNIRSYKNKNQIMKMSLWELPIWPIKTEKKKNYNSSLGSPFEIFLDLPLVDSHSRDSRADFLKELIKNKNTLSSWLKKRLKFLTTKNESNKWWKAIENGRVQSLFELTGIKNPLEDVLFAKNPQTGEFKVWVAGPEVYVKKQERIHRFKSLFNAMRSTYIHELTTLVDDIKLYQKVIDLVLRVQDSLQLPQASLFQVREKDISETKAFIGNEYNKNWGELKKEIWGVIEVAEQLVNNNFSGNKQDLVSLCLELLLKYNDLIKRKNEIIIKVRRGRITALNKRASKRDIALMSNINKIKNLVDSASYAEASKQLKMLARSLKNITDPSLHLIHSKLFVLAKELDKDSVDLKKSFSIVGDLHNQIKNSKYFHQLTILYVDTFLQLKLAKDASIQEIIEKTFELFLQNNQFLTSNDMGVRAFWWAKLNQFVRVKFSQDKSKNLFDAITRFIRILEYRFSIDEILKDKNILIKKLTKTRLLIETLKVNRTFNHLIREDLRKIADALAIDYALNDDERSVILSCILNEQRPEPFQRDLLTKKAA